jgi:uncharacterized protein
VRLFLAWRGLDEWRAEVCIAQTGSAGLAARGVQVGERHRVDYELETDQSLFTRSLGVRVWTESGERSLTLVRRPDGDWSANGEPLPHVSGALDCDLALSPLTNHMPAMRLGGEPADHVMAWVSVPDLEVHRSAQRYEPVDERRVRYVGLDDGFRAVLDLDEHGFVTHYPDLAQRV